MQIRKGQDRIVFVFPSLKIVIKFPIMHFSLAFYPEFIRVVVESRVAVEDSSQIREALKYLKKYLTHPIEYPGGFRGLLFKGLCANWSEFCFYWKTRNSFLQPTYFSFFGLLNVQRYDEPCRMKNTDLWSQLRVLTNDDVYNNPHHFRESHNFCLRNGKLRIFDYGDRQTHEIILRQGAKIVEFFNPAYCREIEKKKLKEKQESTT